MTDKRYSVFVSSTYQDLKEERQEVISALIRRNCFPIAMEYFPSMSRKSIEYIKEAIDKCDFYILIIAGRYGSSVDDDGVSMTEIEYNYAMSKQIPINVYIYEGAPLPSNKIEIDEDKRTRLSAFREKIKNTGYGYDTWTNKDNLASIVKDGIEELKSNSKAVGWIRADSSETTPAKIISAPVQNTREPATIETQLEAENFINSFVERLAKVKEEDTVGSNESLLKIVKGMQSFTIQYTEWLGQLMIAKSELSKIITTLLEKISNEAAYLPKEVSTPASPMGYYGFVTEEIILYTIYYLYKYELYKEIFKIMNHTYVVKDMLPYRRYKEEINLYELINRMPHLNNDIIKTLNGKNYISASAELLLRRASELGFLDRDDLLATDIIMCQLSFIYKPNVIHKHIDFWYPSTISHANQYDIDNVNIIWHKLRSKESCIKMLPLFGVESIEELKMTIQSMKIPNELNESRIFEEAIPSISDAINIDEIATRL